MGPIGVALLVMGAGLLTTSGSASVGKYFREKSEEMKKKMEEIEKEEKK